MSPFFLGGGEVLTSGYFHHKALLFFYQLGLQHS
jgi:hypothetical protein